MQRRRRLAVWCNSKRISWFYTKPAGHKYLTDAALMTDSAWDSLTPEEQYFRNKVRDPDLHTATLEGYLAYLEQVSPRLGAALQHAVPAALPAATRKRHTYIVAAPGSGKSELLKVLIHEEIKAREAAVGHAVPDADPAAKTQQKLTDEAKDKGGRKSAAGDKTRVAGATADDDAGGKPALQDDGLQPDERGITTEVAREKEAKEKHDVVLDEAAHILADEISLVRSDTKLAQQVLPRGAVVPLEVN